MNPLYPKAHSIIYNNVCKANALPAFKNKFSFVYTAKLLLLLFLLPGNHSFAQTFVGVASVPGDGGTQAGPTATLDPSGVGTMQAGDLAIVYMQYRGTSPGGLTVTISATGGQTWNQGTTTRDGTTGISYSIAWCRYNGTWSSSPTITLSSAGPNALTAVMYVFRPTLTNSTWVVHNAQANATVNTNTAQTINGIATTVNRTVTMGFWGNTSDPAKTWTFTGTGAWSRASMPSAQYRNNTGNKLSHTAAYNIQSAPVTAAVMGNATQTQVGTLNTARSIMTWAEMPSNDACSNAIVLTPGATCIPAITVTGTMTNATQTAGVTDNPNCGNEDGYDVWYRFTATSLAHSINLTNIGASFMCTQTVVTPNWNFSRHINIYSGSCPGAGLVPVACNDDWGRDDNSHSLSYDDFVPGTTYYIRISHPSWNSAMGPNGNFDICVTNLSPILQFGKSYTNLSKPNGGIIQTGDTLEFRSAISVSDAAIFRTIYNDTIAAGLTYIPNSVEFTTQEGLVSPSGLTGSYTLTDAADADEVFVSGNMIKVNLASLRRSGGQTTYVNSAATAYNEATAGGGEMRPSGRPSRFRGSTLLLVTYKARVTATTGTNITASYGAFRYKTNTKSGDDVAFPPTVSLLNRAVIAVRTPESLCQTTVGVNAYTNGNFGSGTTRHDSTQMMIVPGYNWTIFQPGGGVNDGEFSVVNNTSADASTNKHVPIVDSRRTFNVWDIIGDHTNASNLDSGNYATPRGTNGGYMVVVNAAYGINNAVQRTITGLCPDTYYEFSAWFKNICRSCSSDSAGYAHWDGALFKQYLSTKTMQDSAGVTPDLTFLLEGLDYYTTGPIPYNQIWMKKGFVFRTGPAQTSVALTIRNNSSGGGGNDWVMDDISFATCLPSLQMTPTNNPTYCLNGQINLGVRVASTYNNYSYYKWERSTDGGATWHPAPELPGEQQFTYTPVGSLYRDTIAYPTIIATAAMNGHRYRIKTATTSSNLNDPLSTCAIYNDIDLLNINVNPSCDVLPTELLSFNAQLKNGYTELKWGAKQEKDLLSYEVERSTDGRNFTLITTVAAKGAGIMEENYTAADPVAVTGKVTYRLKMISPSGITYSNQLSVTANQGAKFEITNLVNPFALKLSFQLTVSQKNTVDIFLADVTGRPVWQTKLNVNKGTNAIELIVPNHLQSGNYILMISSKEGVINKMIQKQ
jgi:trimeric autotransporter adhesin